jgi:hypothetical protein
LQHRHLLKASALDSENTQLLVMPARDRSSWVSVEVCISRAPNSEAPTASMKFWARLPSQQRGHVSAQPSLHGYCCVKTFEGMPSPFIR